MYIRAQNKCLKLVGYLLEITLLHIVIDSTLKLYSEFVLPNWTLLGHILYWVEDDL